MAEIAHLGVAIFWIITCSLARFTRAGRPRGGLCKRYRDGLADVAKFRIVQTTEYEI